MINRRLAEAQRGILASSSWSEDSAESDQPLAMDAKFEQMLEVGDYDGAIEALTTALGIRRRRLTKRQKEGGESTNLTEKDEVGRTLGNYARTLVKKGDVKQASMLYKEAIRVYESNGLDDTHPNIHDLSVELEQLPV